MRGRSPLQSLAASPTMVGAITTLIVIVAVFLAYNANQGLPFVPVYRVSVEIPNAARLVQNNEVRIGGSRVGVVESIEAVRPSGEDAARPPSEAEATDEEVFTGADPNEVVARLNLKLDKDAEPLPQDSVFRVRYRSSFGLKYLEITRGQGRPAPEGFLFDKPDNFVAQTEFDDINNTFDTETRENSRTNLIGFGNAFAGRGSSLNLAIEALDPVFRNLKPVARALAAPETRLRRFFPELGDAARIVAPVAEQQAELFTNMAIAFAAISEDPEALKATISEGVPTLETGIRTLPAQRTFLREFTTLSRELQPGAADLRPTLPVLNEAIDVGTPVLNRSPRLNEKLERALAELEQLAGRRVTDRSLKRLRETFDEAKPLARYVVPAQTVCNYWSYWFNNVPNALSDRDQTGFNLRQFIIGAPLGGLAVNAGPVPIVIPGEVQEPSVSYSGETASGTAGLAPNPLELGVFKPYELPITYGQPYGPTGQRNADCQIGQNGYMLGQLRSKGQPADQPTIAVRDLPGSRGPTTSFFNAEGERTLFDSRIPSRQPGR